MPHGTPCAVVTGANKGIGFAVVQELSKKFKGTVYLAARDATRGQEATDKLKRDGFKNVEFLELDVTNKATIEKARDFLKEKHGGLDVLVNNAGIHKGGDVTNIAENRYTIEDVQDNIGTNFTGLLDVCRTLFPLLRPHARVVNVSSSVGSLKSLPNQAVKKRLVADDLTVEEVEKIIGEYVKTAEKGDAQLTEAGYPLTRGPYTMSKIGVTALSRVQQRLFDQDKERPDIVLNACCPGYVATDINKNAGHRTVEQGADTLVYLALLPAQTGNEQVAPRGELVKERRVVDWVADQ